MDKFEFNCNQLKNIEVPEQWVNKALEIPSKAPKAAPQKSYYRYRGKRGVSLGGYHLCDVRNE